MRTGGMLRAQKEDGPLLYPAWQDVAGRARRITTTALRMVFAGRYTRAL
jgi:hypothetical protein